MTRALVLSLIAFIFLSLANVLCDDGVFLENPKIEVYNYALYLVPFSTDDDSFYGDVVIDILTQQNVNYLQLNSKQLSIDSVGVTESNSNRAQDISSYRVNPETESFIIRFKQPLIYHQTYRLYIEFSGKLNDEIKGLYRIPYVDGSTKKWIIGAQFEPVYARMVFPCFDEPAKTYGAKYRIYLARFSNQIITSDQEILTTKYTRPELKDRVWNILKIDSYFPTYPISFIVSENGSFTEDQKYTIRTKGHEAKDTTFAFSSYRLLSKELQTYLSSNLLTGIMDFFAIPDGTALSEKSGTFVYKEKHLLYNEEEDDEKLKEEIARTMVHKALHFWFGQSVALNWWDDTWQAESLAVFLEYQITAKVQPTWRMNEMFTVEVLQAVLSQDGIKHNLAVASPVESIKDIENKFSLVTNQKGASILRMLEQAFGTEAFRVSIYQTIKNCYKEGVNIESGMLWDQLHQQATEQNRIPSDLRVNMIANLWMDNKGYPIVMITRNRDNGDLLIKQKPFKAPANQEKWIIPISCAKQSSPIFTDTKPTIWLRQEDDDKIEEMLLKNDEWVICNLQQTGYYRVNYDRQNWELLTEQLHSDLNVIHVLNRAQLIDDAFGLARVGELEYSVAFELASYLKNEVDMIPWFSAIRQFGYLFHQYENTDVFDYLKDYVLKLVTSQYQRLGFHDKTGDSHSTLTGRPAIVTLACYLDLEECITNALQTYNTHISDLSSVPANIKYPVYCTALKKAEEEEHVWEELWSLHVNAKKMSLNEVALQALGCSNKDDELLNYLKTIINHPDQILYHYEVETILRSVSTSFAGISAGLNLIEETISIEQSRNSVETIQLLISVANHIGNNIQFDEHLIKLEKLIRTTKSFYQYDELTKALETCREKGVENVEQKSKNGPVISSAISAITGYAPLTQKTTVQESTARGPTTQEPTAQETTTQEPTTRGSTAQESSAQESTQKSTTRETTTQEPTTKEPTTQELTQKPTIQEPTTQRPTTIIAKLITSAPSSHGNQIMPKELLYMLSILIIFTRYVITY